MHSEQPIEHCPNCEADLRPFLEVGQSLPFCHQCRFPLLLVAGKYQLLKQIGEGGFSMVYLASHVGLERNASRVVKLLKPELFDVPGVDRRFY